MGSLSAIDAPLEYPKVRRDESVVDFYHGVPISDPYRWLEDPNREETREFVRRQVEVTESVLNTCDTREKIRYRLNEAFEFERYRVPFRRGNYYFFFHNKGLQPQDVLYIQEDLEAEAKVVLDPNELSSDGTVSLGICAISEDAKYLAYGLSTSGSDWITIKLLRIKDRCLLPDTLSWVKFSGISWTHDGRGFFYSRFPAPKGENTDAGTETNINVNHELYYHVLGTDQSEDILCWKDSEHPRYRFYTKITDDGKYLLLNIGETCEEVNKLYYLNLSSTTNGLEFTQDSNGLLPFKKLVDDLNALYEYVSNDDSIFTFLTNKDAPRGKLVRVDLNEPAGSWIDVLPQCEKNVLVTTLAVNQNQLIVCYLSDVKHVLEIRDLQTGFLLNRLPIDIGTVTISAQRKHSMAFIGFTSFLTFNTVYQCDLGDKVPEMKIFREVSVPGFDRSVFKVDQVFIPSKDGTTKIPMFIVAKKEVVLDRSNPCLLYAYGGFNISLTPCFSVIRTILLRHLDVVFCIANIRGGGEYGEEWHRAGSLDKKQNCFDDFISAAEFLVSNGYTQPSKLCIEGRSNGGLLIGACINQRPDLFGCALAHVGVMDMLRFHKFTIGHAWTCDFGCSDKEQDFRWLIKYSPLHNVRRPWENSFGRYIQYPSTMLLTADHDDRVVPLHSLKLLATMQYTLCTSLTRSPQINPIIGRIECKAGHGCGRPIQKEIDEAADRYSFMAKTMNASWID